jgi:hypothetical protein
MALTEGNEDAGLQAAFEKATAGIALEDADFSATEATAPAADDAPDTPEPDATEQQSEEATPPAKPVARQTAPKARGKEPAAKATEAAPSPVEAQPPANWDAKRKETFGKLPSEAKALVLDMAKSAEADFAKQRNELAGESRYARAVASLVTDEHRRQMAAGGFKNEVEGIAHLIRLNDSAVNDFPGYARWAFGNYARGAPIADVLRQIFPEAFHPGSEQPQGDGQTQSQPRQMADPRFNQVFDTLRTVTNKLDGIEQGNRNAQLRTADNVIARFRDEADDAGNLRHPHFAAVEGNMTRLLKTPDFLEIEDMGERLSRAYDAAVALDPTIRQQYLDGEVARQLEVKRKADDLARAKRARAPITGAATTGSTKMPPKGLDGAIAQAFSLIGG